jgi:coenzyme F420 hydrogenase subunit beta
MGRGITSLEDVVEWSLCVGCGACVYFCREHAIELVSYEKMGFRPRGYEMCDRCGEKAVCVELCPGKNVVSRTATRSDLYKEGSQAIGGYIHIYEGFALNEKIRHTASSGGALSAIALYCLERGGMESVLHTGMDRERPWSCATRLSKGFDDVLENAGSRYCASAPCAELTTIAGLQGPTLFIGKPCDAEAVWYLRQRQKELDKRIGAVFSFFCAGTPSPRATIDLLHSMGLDPEDVENIRYRGLGWPGTFRAVPKRGGDARSLSYEKSWRYLQAYRPFRCHLCADGFGDDADLAFGDGWHRYDPDNENPGLSVIISRTEKGEDILEAAVREGFVAVTEIDAPSLIRSQRLVEKRRELFGRILAMKMLLIPTPHYSGFYLFPLWKTVRFAKRIKTIASTLRRALTRGLLHRRTLERQHG